MQFVLASHNTKKLEEMQQILGDLDISVQSLPADAPEPEETGATFLENAQIKARSAFAHTGLPAIADDSGLMCDALGGAPSIYSARYCEGTDADRNAFLLQNMKGKTDRTAQFVCAICCVLADGTEIHTQGSCAGQITHELLGVGGFGYDPLFYVPAHACTFGELSQQVKNQISHRAVALQQLRAQLAEK